MEKNRKKFLWSNFPGVNRLPRPPDDYPLLRVASVERHSIFTIFTFLSEKYFKRIPFKFEMKMYSPAEFFAVSNQKVRFFPNTKVDRCHLEKLTYNYKKSNINFLDYFLTNIIIYSDFVYSKYVQLIIELSLSFDKCAVYRFFVK